MIRRTASMSNENNRPFFVYATLLSTIGLLASDMYLPALASIRGYFGSDAAKVGLSLSLYMAGFSFAQLFYGALSDQVGRKPPLLVGLSLFLGGTLGCVVATDIRWFLVFRSIQAVGVGAAYVLWQPMVFDLFEGEEVQKLFARLMAVGSLSPALAPPLGGYLTKSFGWHSIFWLLVVLTVVLIGWTSLGYRESLAPAARQPFSTAKVLRQYASFLASRFFMGYALAIGCGIGAYFVFLTMLPFVLSNLGYAPDVIGLMYLPIVASFVVGTEICRRRGVGDETSCRIGAAFGLTGATILWMISLLGKVTSPWQVVPPFMLVTFGNGFLVPTGSTYLIRSHADRSGACASAVGFLIALMAFASTFLASLVVDALGVHAMTGTVFLFAVVMNVSLSWGRSAARSSAAAMG